MDIEPRHHARALPACTPHLQLAGQRAQRVQQPASVGIQVCIPLHLRPYRHAQRAQRRQGSRQRRSQVRQAANGLARGEAQRGERARQAGRRAVCWHRHRAGPLLPVAAAPARQCGRVRGAGHQHNDGGDQACPSVPLQPSPSMHMRARAKPLQQWQGHPPAGPQRQLLQARQQAELPAQHAARLAAQLQLPQAQR